MKRTKLLKHLHRHGCRFDREGGDKRMTWVRRNDIDS